MGICGSRESEEARLRKAEYEKIKAEDAKRHREEIEKRKLCTYMEEDARRHFQKVGNTEIEISEMYNQISCLLKGNKQESAIALARQVVGREEYLMLLRTQLTFLMKQANELEMAQLSVDMQKKMDGINKKLAKDLSDGDKLTEDLIVNGELVRRNGEIRKDHVFQMNNNGANDYKVAAVLGKAKTGGY